MDIQRLIGVYHANGGILGEVGYAVGKLTGTRHCTLCDITHGGLRRRPSWDQMVQGLGVDFDLVHLNERPPDVRRASTHRTPCVLARTSAGLVLVAGPDDLAAAQASPDGLRQLLEGQAVALGLSWPAVPARGDDAAGLASEDDEPTG